MKDGRILKTATARYELVEWSGTNESGLHPVCDKVVVLPDEASKLASPNILSPDNVVDQRSVAAVTGLVIEVGPQAFAYDSDRLVKWEGWRPQPGDRVCFERYAGQEYPGLDGKVYRIMQDTAIGGVLRFPDEAAKKAAA